MAGELLLSALRHVWATLAALQVDAALMGGIAVAAWNHIRNTRDVDVLVGVRKSDEIQLLTQLKKAGFKPLRDPPVLTIGKSRILQLEYEPPGRFLDIRIDLFFVESEYQELALARRVETTIPGIDLPIFMLSCEDLILFKLIAGRIIDRADAAYLLRFNRDTLDTAYLSQWVGTLGLSAEFAEVDREAGAQSDE
jgi:hypothetical protein